MVEIHTEIDALIAAKKAGQAIVDSVVQSKNQAILLLFSGGSPLEILKYLPSEGFDNRITVGVSDERYSTDPAINNFAQVTQADWYKTVISQGVQAIDTRPRERESLEHLGFRFDAALKEWVSLYPDGKIIMTQGIGLDGHTAGMMPFPEDPAAFERLFNTDSVWAVGYDAGHKNKYPLRVTTTIPFLKRVDHSILFVCGPDKQVRLKSVLASQDQVECVPGRIIHQMKACILYTDQPIKILPN